MQFISSIDFNKLYAIKKDFIILINYFKQLKIGLNIFNDEFNPIKGKQGGFWFINKNNLCNHLTYREHFFEQYAIFIIPEDAEIYSNKDIFITNKILTI